MSETSRDDVRAALEEERDLLTQKVHELDAKEDDLSYDGNFADSGQVAAERGENKVLFDQLRKDLDDIEEALRRMDAGTYGTCAVCEKDIGADRLDVMPSTRFCIEHA